jgi:hypothetical protein
MLADTTILHLGAFHSIGLAGNFIADETEKWVEGNQVRMRTGARQGLTHYRRAAEASKSIVCKHVWDMTIGQKVADCDFPP